MRTVYHIALSSDGRYTPREGRYHYRQVPTVETTYLYPQALGRPYVLVPPKHALPTYRQLQLHNPLLNQVKFQPKKGEQPASHVSCAIFTPRWLHSQLTHWVTIFMFPVQCPIFWNWHPVWARVTPLAHRRHSPIKMLIFYMVQRCLHSRRPPAVARPMWIAMAKLMWANTRSSPTTMINTILTIPFNVKTFFLQLYSEFDDLISKLDLNPAAQKLY